MIGTFRRIHLLTALALLLSGLFQPLTAAQGVTCLRTHAPADAASTGSSSGGHSVPTGWLTDDHDHSTIPQPAASPAPSAPCAVAVVPGQPAPRFSTSEVRYLLPQDDLPPTSSHLHSLFRPPRLS